MVKLSTLGRVDLESVPALPVSAILAQPKRLALLLYLALARPRGLRRRDELIAVFWPETAAEPARNSLRQVLHAIRLALGESAIATRGAQEIGIVASALTCDVIQFEEHLRAARREAAVALYRGPFLSAFHLSDAPDFERWVDAERARLSHACAGALQELAETAGVSGQLGKAIAWWRRLAEHDPLSGKYAQGLIRSLAENGEREQGLRVAAAYTRRVSEELGIAPDAGTAQVIAALKAGQLPGPGKVAMVPSLAPATVDSHPVPTTGVVSATSSRSGARRYWAASIGLSLGILMLLALPVTSMLRRAPLDRPLVAKRVLVTTLENRTGVAALNQLGALAADWIADGLLRSGAVEVIDPVTAYYAVRDVQEDSLVSRDNARRLRAFGEAGAAGIVVWGAVEAVADSVVFVVRASDIQAGRLLETIRVAVPAALATTTGVSTVREVVAGALAARSDSTLGALVGKEDAPPRLEAYREFRRGLDHFRPLRYREALDAFLRAARLDSSFILPIVWARYAAGNGGAPRVTSDSLTEVMRGILSRDAGRLSSLDRLSLLSFAATSPVARHEAIAEAARLAPGSNWSYLSGRNQWQLGPAIAALEAVDRRHGWAAGWAFLYAELGRAYHFAGDYDRQLALTREYHAIYPHRRDEVRWLEVTALAAVGKVEELERTIDAMEAGHDTSRTFWLPGQLMLEAGRELRAHGWKADAERFLVRADRWVDAQRASLPPQRYWWLKADAAFYRERFEEAERLDRQAIADTTLPRSWAFPRQLPIAVALQGRRAEAERLQEAFLKQYGDLDRRSLLLVRARFAAALGDADDAVRLFSEGVSLTELDPARSVLEVPYLHGPEWRRIASHPGYQALFKR